jgi:hypothetical protein
MNEYLATGTQEDAEKVLQALQHSDEELGRQGLPLEQVSSLAKELVKRAEGEIWLKTMAAWSTSPSASLRYSVMLSLRKSKRSDLGPLFASRRNLGVSEILGSRLNGLLPKSTLKLR